MKKIKKKILIVLSILVIIVLSGITFVNYELKHMYGGYTEVINDNKFEYTHSATVIINANVLSVNATNFIPDQSVLIKEGKIISIGDSIKLPEKVSIIDASDKYLIPGLIDSHVHLFQSSNDLLLYIANGVTYVREMMGTLQHLKWQSEVNKNSRIGPGLFVASPQLNTYAPLKGWFMSWTRPSINVTSKSKSKVAIESLYNKGYNAIKLGSFLDEENYQYISCRSNKVNIPVIGHLPYAIKLDDLWNSNQQEIAHIEEIVKVLVEEFGKIGILNKEEFLEFVKNRSEEISNKLLKKNVVVTSTLWLTESFVRQKFELENLLKEIKLEYANPGLTEGSILTSRGLGWLPNVNQYRLDSNLDSISFGRIKNYWSVYAEASQILCREMSKRGVKILAGTDANVSAVVPGFSLHDELNSMVKAGMTTSEVLLSVTVSPANWMKINTGRIEVGSDADMVLLNKNPLINIENTKTIEMVISKGKIFKRDQLDDILNEVKRANDKSRDKDISHFIN